MYRKIFKILLVLLCMIIIFSFSEDNGLESNKKSDGTILFISKYILGHKLKENEKSIYINKYVVPVRKSAHFTIYLLLGLSIISLLYEYKIINIKAIVIAMIISILYACSDEIHQIFVSGRTGKIIDVLIDSIGSFVGIMIYQFIMRIRRKKYE